MDDWANSRGQRSDYVSYLLRLWRDDGSEGTASRQPTAPWRGSLENPHTGQRLGFASLEALFDYLQEETGAVAASQEQGHASKISPKPGTLVAVTGICLLVLLIACCVPVGARDAAAQVAPSSPTSKTLGVAAGIGAAGRAVSSQRGESNNMPGPAGIQVALSASHATTSWDERDPAREKFNLPLLTLHQGRAATPAVQRTLMISITGLAGGSEIVIEALSHHKDVRMGEPHRTIMRFVLPNRPCTVADPCVVEWTLDPDTMPSDLYYLSMRTGAGATLCENTRRPAFVILDTWDIGLVASQGPTYTARVYYGTLFPFAKGQSDRTARLSSEQVTDFIEQQFLPIIADIWRIQAEEWGFGDPMHPAWDGDDVLEVIITPPPFALFDGTGTYSVLADEQGRPYPERRIWWLSTSDSFGDYASLADGYKAVFAHEFFHLMQWNVLLNTGRATSYWQYAFIEGQGMFVPSAQYPELALHRDDLAAEQSLFAARASGYLARRLNGSWREMETDGEHRYDAALYWRFLFEAYGDMDVVRLALEEMARHYNPDILMGLGPAINATFARLGGPYHDFQESLIAFSRANYALRLENGRCAVMGPSECAGRYYDPELMYGHPVLETHIQYDGFGRAYKGAIPSSYGMDFLEVGLDAPMLGQPLTIRFQGTGDVARFNLQVWRLKWGEEGPRAVTPQPEVVGQEPDGAYVYHIPALDMTAYDRLALIITRLDSDESVDPVGAYHITIGS
jgi:hypothetical protein